MSDNKPNAVVVRLPLSDAQVLALLDAYTGDKKTTNQKMEDALLAIGTTVAGGELEAVGYITNNRPFGTNTLTHWILYKHRQHDQEYGVVRQSDAQAALAAAQAEIARLWSALDEIEMGVDALPDDNEDYSRMTAREMQRQALIIVKEEMKALKGPEA